MGGYPEASTLPRGEVQDDKCSSELSYAVLWLVTSGEGANTHLFYPEHPSPEPVGCGQGHFLAPRVAGSSVPGTHPPLLSPKAALQGAMGGQGRVPGIAGVSKGFVQNCAAPTAVLCETGGVESLKLPFAVCRSNWRNVALWYLRSAAK